MSELLTPQRGLGEGRAFSPIRFNIYHSEAMKRGTEKRRTLAEKNNHENSLIWLCDRGSYLPSTDVNKEIKRRIQDHPVPLYR